MLTPAAKRRRRAEEATAVLKRPFRSPTVRGRKENQEKQDIQANGKATGQAAAAAATAPTDSDVSPSVSSPERKHKRAAFPILPKATASTLADLVEQFERDIDAGDHIIQRARASQQQQQQKSPGRKDGVHGTESELSALIVRWREAGRAAAEEVFELVSERVARAGGARAWRSMMRQAGSENYQTYDDDRQSTRRTRSDGEDDEDGDGDADVERESGSNEREETSTDADEERFTMAMMLASMQLDPDVLGYDGVEERWKD